MRMCLLLLLFACLPSADIERLVLKDGRQLTGIYDEESQTLTLNGNGLARMTIDPATIVRRIPTAFTNAPSAPGVAMPQMKYLGIPQKMVDELMDPKFTGIQRQTNWCWAACIQMMMRYHGLNVPQEAVVKHIKGNLADKPASGVEMLAAMNQLFKQANGQPLQISALPVNSAADLIHDMIQQEPIIVALANSPDGTAAGHAVVLTGIMIPEISDAKTITDDDRAKVIFYIRDPWPGNQQQTKVTYEEFSQRFLYGLRMRATRW